MKNGNKKKKSSHFKFFLLIILSLNFEENQLKIVKKLLRIKQNLK